MIHVPNNSRWLWSVLGVAVALQSLPGCKQMSVGRVRDSVTPVPYVDPFGSPAAGDRYPTPELTPVPTLPAPGHTDPVDPSPLPPPPAPAAPIGPRGGSPTEASAKSSWKNWNVRSLNFFGRKQAKLEAQPATSSGRHDETSSMGPLHSNPAPSFASRQWTPNRTQSGRSAQSPPIQSTDSSDSGASASRGSNLGADARFASRVSGAIDGYSAPIITPGPQYLLRPEDTIQRWPHAPKSDGQASAIHLRKQAPPLRTEDFAPAGADSAMNSSAASVPLLLPPGP